MSLLDALRNLIRPRAITPSQLFGSGLEDWYTAQSSAGVQVTTRRAMEAALGACVRLLADDISSLPVDVFRKVGRDAEPLPLPPWLVSPSGRVWDTHSTLISDIVVSMGTDGNAFLMVTPDVDAPERVEVLDPDKVDIEADRGGLMFRLEGGRRLGESNIVHIPWVRAPGSIRGLDVVELARETTGLELAAREWAGRFFGHGATLGGIIELPGVRPSTEEADELRKQFAMRHQGRQKSHLFGVLYGGAKYQPTTLKPQEAELAPLWQHVLEEACRTYHIPPHLMASQDPGGSSYSSVEQRSIEYVVHGVATFTTRIERVLSRLIPGADTYLKLNLNGLLRGDVKSRAEAQGIWLDKKVILREEARALEDFPYIGDLGWLETPNNNAPDAERVAATGDAPSLP